MTNNSPTSKSIIVVLFNANGLKNHVNEIQAVLYEKRIDIALITETHFTKYSNIFIPGYTLFISNHPDNTAHGGVAIIIKSTLSFFQLPNFSQDYLQSCAVSIKLNNIPITIAAIYCPPRHNISSLQFVDYFSSINSNFIIGGEINAKHQAWGCRAGNPRGNVLYSFVNAKKYSILAPPGPTYWPTSSCKKPDILDIFIAKVPSNLYCTPENILDLNSDHSSVLLTINASPTIRMTSPKLFYPSTDRIKFHNLVDQEISLNVKLKTHEDIDNAVDKLTSIIQTASWESQTISAPTTHMNLLLPIHLRPLITDKRRARARYQTSRLPSHKALYNKLANSLKKHLLKYKSNIVEQKLSSLTTSDGSLWRETNKLLQ